MAKNTKSGSKFTFGDVGKLVTDIAKTIPIDIKTEIEERKFISTGIYLLDACISANLLNGGITVGRISALLGESGAGKSYLAYSICANAQKEGYSIIYIDTEASIDLVDMPKFGIEVNPEKFMLVRGNRVEDINITITKLLDSLREVKMKGDELPKILIALDSVGQMTSKKEKEDLIKGDNKQDMTRAKALNAMFRSITTDLESLDIPMVVCNHTYLTQDLFPKEISKGGLGLVYASSLMGFMSKAKLKDGSEDAMDLGQSGIVVTFKSQKNRLAKPKKIKFEISFGKGLNKYTGLEAFCTPEYFDTVGIARGKMDKGKFTPSASGRWYVKHLDKSFTNSQIFNSTVFNDDVMKSLEPIINSYFAFASNDEAMAMEKDFMNQFKGNVDDNEFIDADDIFGDVE